MRWIYKRGTMSNHFDLIPFDQLKEGELVLSFGVHVLRWNFSEWGNPAYAFVESKDEELENLREKFERLKEAAEPFAKEGAEWISSTNRAGDNDKIMVRWAGDDEEEESEALFTVGDLRRISKLLKEFSNE